MPSEPPAVAPDRYGWLLFNGTRVVIDDPAVAEAFDLTRPYTVEYEAARDNAQIGDADLYAWDDGTTPNWRTFWAGPSQELRTRRNGLIPAFVQTPVLQADLWYTVRETIEPIGTMLVDTTVTTSAPLACPTSGTPPGTLVLGAGPSGQTFVGAVRNYRIIVEGRLRHWWPLNTICAEGGLLPDIVGGAHATLEQLGSGSWVTSDPYTEAT